MNSADPVNHPAHYNAGPIEVIDIIEGFRLGFHLGNVVKYVLRSPHKGAQIQDLRKAQWYLERYIEQFSAVNIAKRSECKRQQKKIKRQGNHRSERNRHDHIQQ